MTSLRCHYVAGVYGSWVPFTVRARTLKSTIVRYKLEKWAFLCTCGKTTTTKRKSNQGGVQKSLVLLGDLTDTAQQQRHEVATARNTSNKSVAEAQKNHLTRRRDNYGLIHDEVVEPASLLELIS